MLLRPAQSNDVTAIQAIAREAYSIYLERMDRPPGPMLADYADLVAQGRVSVLVEDDQVVAYLVLICEGEVMLLDNVAVSPDFQGRGIARALLDHAEAMARAEGCRAIHLYTHELMTENQALYPRFGYRETHRGEEAGYARVYFEKAL